MAYCSTRCRIYLLLFISILAMIQYMFVLKTEKNRKVGEKHIHLLDPVLERLSKRQQKNTPAVKHVTNEYGGNMSNITLHTSCPNLKTPKFNQASSGKWIPVGDNRDLFVFSAFYEDEKNEIVVTGIKRSAATHATCQVWYDDGTADVGMEETPLNVKLQLPESHKLA